jgi:hypothetical protein
MRAVVRPDAGVRHHVEGPENVRVQRTGFDHRQGWRLAKIVGFDLRAGFGPGRRAGRTARRHEAPFLAKRAVVAVGQAARVETQDFAAIADDIHAVALDGGGRGNAAVRPVKVRVFTPLGHDELPQ